MRRILGLFKALFFNVYFSKGCWKHYHYVHTYLNFIYTGIISINIFNLSTTYIDDILNCYKANLKIEIIVENLAFYINYYYQRRLRYTVSGNAQAPNGQFSVLSGRGEWSYHRDPISLFEIWRICMGRSLEKSNSA